MAHCVLIARAVLPLLRGIGLLWLEQVRNLLMSSAFDAISIAWSIHSFWGFNLPVSPWFIIWSFLFSKWWPFLKEECKKRADFPKKKVIQRGVKYLKEGGKKIMAKIHFSVWQQAWIRWEISPYPAYGKQILRLLATLAIELLLLLSWGCWYHTVWSLGSHTCGRHVWKFTPEWYFWGEKFWQEMHYLSYSVCFIAKVLCIHHLLPNLRWVCACALFLILYAFLFTCPHTQIYVSLAFVVVQKMSECELKY